VPQTATAMVTGSPRKNHALPAAKTALSGLPAAARLHCRESQEEVRNEDRGERRDTWRRLAVFTRECDGIRSSASFTLCVPPENADECFPDSSQGRGITRSCPNRRHQRGLGYFRVVLGLGAREGGLRTVSGRGDSPSNAYTADRGRAIPARSFRCGRGPTIACGGRRGKERRGRYTLWAAAQALTERHHRQARALKERLPPAGTTKAQVGRAAPGRYLEAQVDGPVCRQVVASPRNQERQGLRRSSSARRGAVVSLADRVAAGVRAPAARRPGA